MKNKIFSSKYSFLILLFLIGIVFPLVFRGPFTIHIAALIFLKIILCLTLRQMLLTGLLNLSIVAFMAIGAYFTALMGTTFGLSFWLVMPMAGLLCALIGFFFAFPLLRLKGAYFFLATVCFAVCVQTVFSNFFVQTFAGVPGFTPIEHPSIGISDFQFTFSSHLSYYYLIYAVMLIAMTIYYRLEHSRFGQYWKAISVADRLIETVGVDLLMSKILNFTISCFVAGITGAIFAPFMGIITPHDFDLGFMFLLVMFAVVGGLDYFWGPVTGVIVISVIAEILRDFGQYETIGYGFILVLVLIFMPKGLFGFVESFLKYFTNKQPKSA